jgi:hypothetical protein
MAEKRVSMNVVVTALRFMHDYPNRVSSPTAPNPKMKERGEEKSQGEE